MNTLGTLFKVSSFGESHGSHVGCLVEGCPAGLQLNVEAIQLQVNRRKTNQASFTSSRSEADQVAFLSGIFEGKTTGAPIVIAIKNLDAHAADYDELKTTFRPNHADYTNFIKYGIRDHRGGGRSSIRVTAPLVAAGEIACQFLQTQCALTTQAYVSQIGNIGLPRNHHYNDYNLSTIDASEVRCPNETISNQMIELIEHTKNEGDTLGGVIHCVVKQVPTGLGDPIFSKLQAQLAHAMLSINTAKGFEYGLGFESATKTGSEYSDEFMLKDGNIKTRTNHSGGIQGGISNGMDIYFSVAFKPISSIQKIQQTIDIHGNTTSIEIKGRHDVCAVPRAIPIVEAYTNIVLADALLHSKLARL